MVLITIIKAFIIPMYLFPIYIEEPESMIAKETVIEDPWMDFKATAYVADCEGCVGITKSGYDVRNTIYSPQGHRVIAVDPDEIPLDSLVEIKVNGEIFIARAMDIGGAIKGRKIDLLVDSEANAFEWGVKDIKLRVIEE